MNLLIYLTLIAPTAMTFPAAGHSAVLMTLAAIKCLLLGLVFMNLRHAHVAWRIGFAGVIGLFLSLFPGLS